MSDPRWLLAACVLAAACTGAAPIPFAQERMDAGASRDAQPEHDAQAERDAAAVEPPSPTPVVLPAIAPAERTLEARSEIECASVPGVAGFYTPARVFVHGNQVYVFSVDSTDVSPVVLMHVSPIEALAFGEPTPFVYGARAVDLTAEGQTLRALSARQFYTVERISTDDGVTWSDEVAVGPHQPTYNCEGYPPPRYFRGPGPLELLTVGNDYNTSLFGCYERVFVAQRTQDGWMEPVEVGRGDVSFAFQGDSRALIVTNLGVLRSEDDGATWVATAGLGAVSGVFTGARVVLARSVPGGVAVLRSEDEGATWSEQLRVLDVQATQDAAIAADGTTITLAAFSAGQLVLSTSTDDGARWTEPKVVARPGTAQLLGLAQREGSSVWLTAGLEDALEVCVLR